VTRPGWHEYFLGIAEAVAQRSDCERSKVGAVVVKDRRIRATGYNGAPSGAPGCATCPRRRHPGVAAGSSDYDRGPTRCVAVHAEANALLYCDREDLIGATLYITRAPCAACSKLIEATGITQVAYPGELANGVKGSYAVEGINSFLHTIIVPEQKGYTLEDLMEMKQMLWVNRVTDWIHIVGGSEDHIIRSEN